MSTPLTDGINALTQYANEVTGKSDTTLSDAVGSLVEGYGGGKNWFKDAGALYYFFYDNELPENFVLDFEGNTISRSCECAFANVKSVKHLTLKNLTISTTMAYMFNGGSFETITLENCVLLPTRINRMLSGNTVKSINYEFDLSSVTGGPWDMLYFCKELEDIRFKPNTIKNNFPVSGCYKLSVDSVVSIANGLNNGTPYKLQDIRYLPTKPDVIMGNNIDGLFVADENGTLTLADFITTVKGWTLA